MDGWLRVNSPIILTFDVRCRPARKDVPLTVDTNMWEQACEPDRIYLRKEAARISGREEASLISPLDMTMLTCLPQQWLGSEANVPKDLVIVAFASVDIGPARQAYRISLADGYYGCRITYEDLVREKWISLGFDLCDDSLSASLLYSGQNGISGLINEIPELQGWLNEYGLFSDWQVASSFAVRYGEKLSEHAPFVATEILLAGNGMPR